MADSVSTGYHYPKKVENLNARTPHWTSLSEVVNNQSTGASEGSDPDTHHADCNIPASQNSDSIKGSEYGFDLNLNARVDGIRAKVVRHGQGMTDYFVVAALGNNDLNNKGKNRKRTDSKYIVDGYGGETDKWGASVIKPSQVNDDDFSLRAGVHNTLSGAGTHYMHTLALGLYYTDPTYSLAATITSQQTIGKNIVYTLTLKNTNSIHQGYSIPVSLSIPAGLSYVSAKGNGSYNSSTKKWNAVLSNGSATLTLTLQSTTLGVKTITASVDDFSTTLSKSTTIIAPKYTLNSNLPQQATQGDTVTYEMSITSDSPTKLTDTFNLTIPNGLAYVSCSGNGSYNSSTGVLTATFVNQKCTITFNFTAITGGEFNQILTGPDGSSLTKTILVISTGDTDCFYTLRKIPDYIKALMTSGQIYTISCYSKIVDSSLTYVYPGLNNFKIAAVQAIDNIFDANIATGTDTKGNTTGFSASTGETLLSSVEWAEYGSRSLKIQTNGSSTYEGYYLGSSYRKAASEGDEITIKQVAYGLSGSVQIGFSFYNSAGSVISTSYQTVNLTGLEHEIIRTAIAPAGTASVGPYANTGTTIQAISFYIDTIIGVHGTNIPEGIMDLVTGDINSDEEIGTRVDTLNDIQRVYATFEYDENKTPFVKLYGQYINRSPSTATVRFFGFALHAGTDVNWDDPGILFDDINQLIQNEDYATAILPSNQNTNPLLFDEINFAGHENDPNLIIKGVSISFNYYASADIAATATLIVGDDVSIKSTILSANSILAEIGGDKWNLKNIDLNELSFLLQFDNNTVDTQTIQVINVEITIEYQYDETGGNLGFILDGEHSRNYNMFLTSDFDIAEGLAKDIDTLDIKKSVGDLITGESIKSKTIKLPFTIVGNSLEEFQERFAEAVKWMSNDLDDGKRPIPKPLVFDWDPNREWMVVLNDAVDKSYDIGKMEGTAEFLIPSGSAKGPLKVTGDVGSNDGLTTIKPIIMLKATGENSIIVKEAKSGKSLILNHAWDTETILYIDCEKNRIYDDYNVDCTGYLALNSDLLMLDPGAFDFSQSTGCVVLSVQFNEGL